MEFVIILIVSILLLLILAIMYSFNIKNIKKIKNMANIEKLDKIAKKYPENIEICQEYLNKLKNGKVKVEENKDSDVTIYIALSDKILIGNLKNSYTRIQTIAHECLHSIQSRKLLIFNFIFSNIYLLYFLIIILLNIFNKIENQMFYLEILTLFGLIYYSVRMYLENDAMIKAKYLAKEYMEEKNISTKEEIDEIVKQYDKVNEIGIKFVNYQMLSGIIIKIMIFAILSMF